MTDLMYDIILQFEHEHDYTIARRAHTTGPNSKQEDSCLSENKNEAKQNNNTNIPTHTDEKKAKKNECDCNLKQNETKICTNTKHM